MDLDDHLDRCRHGQGPTERCEACDVEWSRVDARAPLFRCSLCRCLFLEVDRDDHAEAHAKAA